MISSTPRSAARSELTPRATTFSASMSRPESVSSSTARRRLDDQHLQDLVAFLLAAREPFVHAARQEALVHLHELHLGAHQLQEFVGIHFGLSQRLAPRVHRGLEQVDVVDAGNFHRVLESEEQPGTRTLFGRQRKEVTTFELHAAAGDFVAGPAGEHVRQRALARSIGAHDGVHLAGIDGEGQSLQHLLAADGGGEILDLQHWRRHRLVHPTAPSRLTANRACASTANSMGNSLRTVLQKPLTIMFTASSSSMPRCRQ